MSLLLSYFIPVGDTMTLMSRTAGDRKGEAEGKKDRERGKERKREGRLKDGDSVSREGKRIKCIF